MSENENDQLIVVKQKPIIFALTVVLAMSISFLGVVAFVKLVPELLKKNNIPSGSGPAVAIISGDEEEITNSTDVEEKKERVIDPEKPMVALTFDDGPNANSTPRILDVLEEYGVVATFFDLGYLVDRMPDITKREEEIGCEVGNHSYNHKNFIKLTASQIQDDMKKSEASFESALGHVTALFRPPYGNVNGTVKANINYPLIRWNVDTVDWKTRNKDKIVEEVRRIENLDGRIILMHSIYESTADAVEVVVPELIEQGYQLVTVSELYFYKTGEELEPGHVYNGFRVE